MKFRLKISDIKDALSKLQSFLSANWKLYITILVYVIVFSAIMIFKHNSFFTSGFDLGIFNQSFWTTLFERKLFYSTGDLSFNPGGSFFGVHFSPMLFLLLPFYAIYPSVETLLVLQSIVLALGAIPLYWMGREKLGKNVALCISILYLVYPPLNYLNLNDFHLQAFLPTFFLFAVYYLEREKWPHFLAFVILSMTTIEFTQIIAIFVALYGLILYRRRKFVDSRRALKYIILTFLISVLWFILALKVKEFFNPYTSPVPTPFHLAVSDPISGLCLIFNDWGSKVFYIICFLAPLAFTPLLALEPLVMTIPWIGASFITNHSLYYSVYSQYTGFIIPFIFIALIKAIERLTANGIAPKRVKKILLMLFLATTVFAVYTPFAPGSPWMYQIPVSTEQSRLLNEVLLLVPQNAPILTQNNIFPHVSNRLDAFMYIPPNRDVSVEYILVDVNSIWYDWGPDISGEKLLPSDVVPEALRSREYGIFASAKGMLLLKKDYTDVPIVFVPYTAKYDYRVLTLPSGSIIEDNTSSSGRILCHDRRDDKGVFWCTPYINLPPGLYNVTYVVKTRSEVNPSDEILAVYVENPIYKIAEKHVYGEQFSSKGQWFNLTLTFGLDNVVENIELKGLVYSDYEIYLDYIDIEQLSPKPS